MRVSQIAATFLGLGAVGGVAFLLATRRLVVEGRSMLPAYAPGDRVLVNRLAYVRARPAVGDVVVARLPFSDGREVIKRIAAGPGETATVRGEPVVLGPDEWFVVGDNAEESTDSRELGPCRRQDILGRVVLKY